MMEREKYGETYLFGVVLTKSFSYHNLALVRVDHSLDGLSLQHPFCLSKPVVPNTGPEGPST